MPQWNEYLTIWFQCDFALQVLKRGHMDAYGATSLRTGGSDGGHMMGDLESMESGETSTTVNAEGTYLSNGVAARRTNPVWMHHSSLREQEDKEYKRDLPLRILAWRVSPAALSIFLSVGTSMLVFPFFTYVHSTGLLGERLPQVNNAHLLESTCRGGEGVITKGDARVPVCPVYPVLRLPVLLIPGPFLCPASWRYPGPHGSLQLAHHDRPQALDLGHPQNSNAAVAFYIYPQTTPLSWRYRGLAADRDLLGAQWLSQHMLLSAGPQDGACKPKGPS